MKVRQLLPSRLRVATQIIAQDASNVVHALRDKRTKSHRVRTPARFKAEVRQATQALQTVPDQPDPIVEEFAVITFADSGVQVVVTDPEQTLLEAGEAAGVDLVFSCRVGGCAACLLELREGVVEYEDRDAICLTDQDIESGDCLACVGRPRGRVVVSA